MDEETQSHYNGLIDGDVETLIRRNPSSEPIRNYISSSAERTMIKVGAKGVSSHSSPMASHLMDIRLRDQYIIGMVGEMGSGKSFHGEMYATLGEMYKIPTHNIDMDSFIGTIYKAGPEFAHIREDVASLFGDEVLNEDGSINVDVLRPLVFSQPEMKEKIDIIMKPAMATVLRDTLADKKGLIIINAALLPDHDR
jgi:Dephospho-CoA kinase